MLNELFGRYKCPVCGRTFSYPMTGWWCPLCGEEFSDNVDKGTNPPRLTTRDTEGAVMYIGEHGFQPKSYLMELSTAAIMEMMERLCRWEEGYYTNQKDEDEEADDR